MDPVQTRKMVKERVMQEGKDVKDILETYGNGFLDLGDLEVSFEGNNIKIGRRLLMNSVIVPVISVPKYEIDGIEVNDTLDAKIVEVERILLLAFKDVYAPGELDYSPTTACVGRKLFGFTKFEREKKRIAPIVLIPTVPSQPQQPIQPKKRIVPTLIDPVSRAPIYKHKTEGEKKEYEMLKHSKVLGPLLKKEGMIDF